MSNFLPLCSVKDDFYFCLGCFKIAFLFDFSRRFSSWKLALQCLKDVCGKLGMCVWGEEEC